MDVTKACSMVVVLGTCVGCENRIQDVRNDL
jgi:hypothetical protein